MVLEGAKLELASPELPTSFWLELRGLNQALTPSLLQCNRATRPELVRRQATDCGRPSTHHNI
eukprot:1147353-Pelagomonas_calceolata.AAC.3